MTTTIVYWSGTGNTEAMSALIEEGLKEKGVTVSRAYVGEIDDDTILRSDLIVLGCPSMGDEILEESEFEPWMSDIQARLAGKKVALFGSYDWGDGQWMRDWQERLEDALADVVATHICHLTPEGETADACKAFGQSLA